MNIARCVAASGVVLFASVFAVPTKADIVHNDDVIITFSLCVGNDCVNGENFGFDTIRLKENNLRIQFNDTSSAGSFPTNNWQIRANSSANGGDDFLAFVDQGAGGTSETGTIVFAVEAGAGANALFVNDAGRVGLGTGTPVVELHVVDGDTPTLRLDQDNSSGFTPQVWDVAGNETNFFVRDTTGGSALPFRIQPGTASNTLFLANTERVGIGTSSPDVRLHVEGSDSATGGSNGVALKVENTNATSANREMLTLVNNGASQLSFEDPGVSDWLLFNNTDDSFRINRNGSGVVEMIIENGGDVTIGGTLTENSSREVKEDFVKVDPADVLARLQQLEIQEWTYKHTPGYRRLGPFAEDFHQAFGLGRDNKHVAPSDVAGVALVAIQGLTQQVKQKDQQIAALSQRVETLENALTISGK